MIYAELCEKGDRREEGHSDPKCSEELFLHGKWRYFVAEQYDYGGELRGVF